MYAGKQSSDVMSNHESYLDTEIGRGSSYESEWCTDMNLLDDVPGIVGGCVQHAIVRETGIVHDVVNLAVLATIGCSTLA